MYKRLRLACYSTGLCMSVVANLSPVLFLTFRAMYDISYTMLGLLVLINFVTQLMVDLAFSFFSHKFNIPKVVKATPVLTFAGLLIYALWPFFFADSVYVGLVIGTVAFSAASGFAEVLISPVIAALPSDNPDRDMSRLHSVYAWGSVAVLIISTLFLFGVGQSYWQWLVLFFTIVPLGSTVLYIGTEIPAISTPEKTTGALQLFRQKGLLLCVFSIFLGGAAELVMAQWSSSYLEMALGIPKVWGDIFGVALFSVMMGLGRTLYAKKGKNLKRVLLLSTVGSTVCYLICVITDIALLGLAACAFCGLCVAMLWPGNLVVAADRFPESGVFIYALMAAGGDLGASVGPQLVGVITDVSLLSPTVLSLASKWGLSPEQIGMKMGLLAGMLFPLAAIWVTFLLFKKKKTR